MEWHLILARDGTVVAVADGAPVTWIGTRLERCPDAHEDLKAAVAALVGRAAHSPSPVESTMAQVPSAGGTVRVTLIDALPLHRQPTNVSALLRSSLRA